MTTPDHDSSPGSEFTGDWRDARGVVGGTEPAEKIVRRMRGDDDPTPDSDSSMVSARGTCSIRAATVLDALAEMKCECDDSYLSGVIAACEDLIEGAYPQARSDVSWFGPEVAELLDWIKAHDLHNDASFPAGWRDV